MIAQSEHFQWISNTNIIKNLTIESVETLKELEFIIQLCPRLRYLPIDKVNENFIPILIFLLSKNNHYLNSFCLK
ncbi:unnamed protein product [Adineta steineri]|uniref:Uncharacterized protein n=1 Tax=Adineta steineri TaxID=433720 RepID=A0A814WUS6_9BILA|nr:unnamed protein product [Adineta steineri]CAF1489891.1 unnamed protein product [Adineta steineri]